MKWKGRTRSSNVEDRRGAGSMGHLQCKRRGSIEPQKNNINSQSK